MNPNPADKIERRAIETLVPNARNARTHTPEQIAQIAASMREFGWTIPILIDDEGTIIAGHGRVMAAQSLGIADIPVIIARDWSDAKKRAYMLADNKLALNAGWDFDLLKIELADISAMGFDIGLAGFSADELAAMIGGPPAEALPSVSLADRFGIAPFSVLNAREGWWQSRKAAWIGLGIQSELGRGEQPNAFPPHVGKDLKGGMLEARAREKARRANATPGGSAMPAADYSKSKARGDGRGRAINGAQGWMRESSGKI